MTQDKADRFDEGTLYDCNDAERLMHEAPDDAIEESLDLFLSPEMTPAQVLAALPETITVTAYEPDVVTDTDAESLAERALELAVEQLDENYNCGEDPTEPTEAMLAAATAFAKAIIAEYHVYNHEPCGSREIVVADWVRENRPDWLEGEAVR